MRREMLPACSVPSQMPSTDEGLAAGTKGFSVVAEGVPPMVGFCCAVADSVVNASMAERTGNAILFAMKKCTVSGLKTCIGNLHFLVGGPVEVAITISQELCSSHLPTRHRTPPVTARRPAGAAPSCREPSCAILL